MTKTAFLLCTALAALPLAAQAERGADGDLRIHYWQVATHLNPYLSGIAKEVEAASLVLEPLARFDEKGALVPWLAESIPTVENGGLAADMRKITWKLREGLLWSDGSAVTAEDAVFTWGYCTHPNAGCAALAMFDGVTDVVAVDDRTIEINFAEPKPYPYVPFVSSTAPILQAAQFKDCTGERMAQCTEQNFRPIGTGPYKVDEFLTNDIAVYSINPNFRFADKPHFANVSIKGGGDPAGAARAVLETGEVDYAWNLQIAPDVLAAMAGRGIGDPVVDYGAAVEFLFFNLTNPDPALGEARSTVQGGDHPILGDIRVRQALSMAIDRTELAEVLYGDLGRPTCNVVPAPELYASTATAGCEVADPAGAMALLDEAGWTDTDGDGIRDKDGRKLSLSFTTSTNSVRQDTQMLIQQWWSQIGVQTELRNVAASVYFGGDVGNPDTRQKFFADVQMYTDNSKGQDPEAFLARWTCKGIPSPANQWQGSNVQRFCDPAFDALSDQFRSAASLEDRGRISKEMNDLLVNSHSIAPLIHRGNVSGKAKTLAGNRMNSWDSQIWDIMDWHRAK